MREALTFAVGACRDEALQALFVRSVDPAPDASRLEVTLEAPDSDTAAAASERVAHVTAMLRAEVAASVRRRRAPELVYRVVPAGEGSR